MTKQQRIIDLGHALEAIETAAKAAGVNCDAIAHEADHEHTCEVCDKAKGKLEAILAITETLWSSHQTISEIEEG